MPITRVYTRRNNSASGLQVLPHDDQSGNIPPTLSDNLPIALRKGVRECTKHPLYTFLAYDRLGSNLANFTSNVDRQWLPSNISEALNSPVWKVAVEDELHALSKNKDLGYSAYTKGNKDCWM